MTVITPIAPLISGIFHHYPKLDENATAYVWEEITSDPFEELIVSWNAQRPLEGDFRMSITLKLQSEEWSPKMLYMQWGSSGQKSFDVKEESSDVHVYQDCIELLKDKKATAFRVSIEATEKADLGQLWAIHAYAKMPSDSSSASTSSRPADELIDLLVSPISQIVQLHPRARHLCSPTSTTTVVQYLLKSARLDPLEFARQVKDEGFDIYGNWVLNVVQASHELGKSWQCWVARLEKFQEILDSLALGMPVVVSVRGPLTGSAFPYEQGHLIVVRGYDPITEKVLCMDPAFPTHDQTYVSYALEEFMQAWSRRGRVAYLFQKSYE
ncbi:MAG: C39 family peptidase [Chlamydiales bacterium]